MRTTAGCLIKRQMLRYFDNFLPHDVHDVVIATSEGVGLNFITEKVIFIISS